MRHLDGYGEVSFPHCACDSRKDGHVIAVIGASCFKLLACKTDGTPEVSNSVCDFYASEYTVIVSSRFWTIDLSISYLTQLLNYKL